jgi:hypothetical protein
MCKSKFCAIAVRKTNNQDSADCRCCLFDDGACAKAIGEKKTPEALHFRRSKIDRQPDRKET